MSSGCFFRVRAAILDSDLDVARLYRYRGHYFRRIVKIEEALKLYRTIYGARAFACNARYAADCCANANEDQLSRRFDAARLDSLLIEGHAVRGKGFRGVLLNDFCTLNGDDYCFTYFSGSPAGSAVAVACGSGNYGYRYSAALHRLNGTVSDGRSILRFSVATCLCFVGYRGLLGFGSAIAYDIYGFFRSAIVWMAIAVRGSNYSSDLGDLLNGRLTGLYDLFLLKRCFRAREEYNDRDHADDVIGSLCVSLLVASGRKRAQAFDDA